MAPASIKTTRLQQGVAHHQAGRLAEAESLYRQVLELDPDSPDALHYLGVIAHQAGRHEAAVNLIEKALARRPDDAAMHGNLGEAYRLLQRWEEAVGSFQRALARQPDYPVALSNLGNALVALGRGDEAIRCFQRALALQPDFASVHNNLGTAWLQKGDFAEAAASFRRALALDPGLVEAHNNLGKVAREVGQLDVAAACFEQALIRKPDFAEAHNNLGGVFKDRGQSDQAVASFRRALDLRSGYASAHSNLVLALHYRQGDEPEVIAAETRRWEEQHAKPLVRSGAPHANDRSADRPLRIGYCSADFRQHPVAYFLLPLLQAHDRGRFHITAYSTGSLADEVTTRFRACTDEWRSLVGLSDEAAAARIREDRIDLLVDLSGHTAGNRLLVFARRPAPVQVSYLGYPGFPGLETIDHWLTDVWTEPAGTSDGRADRTVRLPQTAWCFSPLSGEPPVVELPARRRGFVTFGCFNHFAKVTEDMRQLWVRVLLEAPGSRLVLKNLALGTSSVATELRAFFVRRGIAAERLELMAPRASLVEHLQAYGSVDLALDTFPYHGTTTTCEALWMGVPVLTLAGSTPVSRVGVSLLTNVGLTEFVARDREAYVRLAAAAARDPERLASLRGELRERMARSPLMDAPRLAREIEQAYRTMWHRWCAGEAERRQ